MKNEQKKQKEQPQAEADENEPESEGGSQIIRADNFLIVDLKAYNTEKKEAHFIEINQTIDKMTGDKTTTEETIKKGKLNFIFYLKTLFAKSATDADPNRIRDAMRRGKNTTPEQYRAIFEKLSNKRRLTFNNEIIIVPAELRRKPIETLHSGHAGTIKMLSGARIFWWPNITREIEEQTKNCVSCMDGIR